MRNFLGTSNDADLVKGTDLGAQASMNTENLAVYDSPEDKKVEHLAAALPNRGIAIFLLALFVKPIHLSDLARLVIASYKGDTVRISSNKL